ncbi:hypothetical protein I6E29_04140 [Arcanobacterium haemolyticum]|nr:hypothetical protein [Arcanobacterium haemolyticum]
MDLKQRTLIWRGHDDDLECRLLRAGSTCTVIAVDEDLPSLVARRESSWLGVVLPVSQAVDGLRVCLLNDGLAKAVGGSDCVAWVSALPDAFGFLSYVGGIVAALKDASGKEKAEGAGVIRARGPRGWASVAALTQLGYGPVDAEGDPMTAAVAHRLGVTLGSASPVVEIGDDEGLAHVLVEGKVLERGLVELHAAAAQIRLLTSGEPNMKAMRKVIAAL